MSRLLNILVCLVVVHVAAAADLNAFNCKRTTTNICLNGGSCDASGSCTCTSPNQNYDCGDVSTDDHGTPSSCGCLNGGICKDDNTCKCPETHYSGTGATTCDLETINFICTVSGKIIINVNYPNIDNIIVYEKDTKGPCTFASPTGGDIPANWLGKSREILVPTDPTCGSHATETINGQDANCVTIRIQHNAAFVFQYDVEAKFCCGDTVSVKQIGNIGTNNVLPSSALKTVNQVQLGAGQLTVSMVDGSGVAIPDGTAKNIGETIFLKIELGAAAAFDSIRVTKAKASHDAAASDPAKTTQLIINSCPAPSNIAGPTSRTGGGKIVLIEARVIWFNGEANVFYTCDVLVCTLATRCVPILCSNGASGHGRKKREATFHSNSTSDTTKTLTTYITINNPGTSRVEKPVQNEIAKSTSINLTGAVIGLAVAILVLLAVCLVLGVCLITRRAAPTPLKG